MTQPKTNNWRDGSAAYRMAIILAAAFPWLTDTAAAVVFGDTVPKLRALYDGLREGYTPGDQVDELLAKLPDEDTLDMLDDDDLTGRRLCAITNLTIAEVRLLRLALKPRVRAHASRHVYAPLNQSPDAPCEHCGQAASAHPGVDAVNGCSFCHGPTLATPDGLVCAAPCEGFRHSP